MADDTFGGTPKLSNNGLKIAPPPNPNAPETQPPRNAKVTNLITVYLSNLISLFEIPKLNFNLSAYSCFICMIAFLVTRAHTRTKANITNQSNPLHLVIPKIDGDLSLPLNRVSKIKATRTMVQSESLFH